MTVSNFRSDHLPTQEQRSADILDFKRVQTFPPGPRPYDPNEYALLMRVAEMARHNTEVLKAEAAERRKNNPPGSVGAARVPPDDDPGDPGDARRSNRVPFHEATRIYPPLDGEPLKRLKTDIRARGKLIKLIVRCKDENDQWAILDGRARYDICLELGIEPKFADLDIPEPETYLVSANLHRDLSALQRDLIAARTVTAKGGGDRNSLAKKSNTSTPATCGGGGKPKERTIEEAAAIYYRNSAGVERARTILNLGTPHFITCIERADYSWVSVKRAIDTVTLTNKEKLDGLTSEEKQRQWLKDNRLFKRDKKPPLSPFESFVRKWRYLTPEDQRRFAVDIAMSLLIAEARLERITEIALPDAKIIIDP